MAEPEFYVGTAPARFDFEGSPVVIGPSTVAHRDSAIRKANPDLFRPMVVHFDAPEAKKAEPKAAEKAEPKAEKAEPKRTDPEPKVEPEKRLHTR